MAVEVGRGDGPVAPRSLAELRSLIGTELGPTEWQEVSQEGIDAFAAATGDFQWIHVDVERAAAAIGTTIAHGLYTLSLGPGLSNRLLSFEGFDRAVNYGFERVRFPAPVPSGSRLRMRLRIDQVSEVDGGAQVTMSETFECEGVSKPVCVATALARFYEA